MNQAQQEIEIVQKELSIEGILFVHSLCVPSTMDTVLSEFPYLLEFPNKLIAFSASSQTGARGSNGRVWISRGQCVALSLACVVPGVDKGDVVLGHVLALSALRVLKSLYRNDEFLIKWPNDILLRGLKIGGVLVECHPCSADFQIVVLGIGLNLDVPQTDTISRPLWPAGSVNKILDVHDVTEADIRRAISVEFYHDLSKWRNDGFVPFVKLMTENLAGLGDEVQAVHADQVLVGKVAGIGEDGCLLLTDADGMTSKIYQGEIKFAVSATTV